MTCRQKETARRSIRSALFAPSAVMTCRQKETAAALDSICGREKEGEVQGRPTTWGRSRVLGRGHRRGEEATGPAAPSRWFGGKGRRSATREGAVLSCFVMEDVMQPHGCSSSSASSSPSVHRVATQLQVLFLCAYKVFDENPKG